MEYLIKITIYGVATGALGVLAYRVLEVYLDIIKASEKEDEDGI